MRTVFALFATALVAVGCRTPEEPGPDPAGAEPATRASVSARSSKGGGLSPSRWQPGGNTNAPAGQPVVLPASGRVHMVNLGLRFVVIDYTLGGMPSMGSVLDVYRNDEKVARVRLSGPEPRNGFVTADILEGFIQVDDQVRFQ